MAKTPAKKTPKPDPQSGMYPVGKPSKTAVRKKFDDADAKADPAEQEIADIAVSRTVRGW